MMYNRNPVTPFELTDNQQTENPVQASLPGDFMSINKHFTNMEQIYQSMLGKTCNTMKKTQEKQQELFNKGTYNSP